MSKKIEVRGSDGDQRQGGAWLGLGGGGFAAEEGLIEGVDAGVQGAHILEDFGHLEADGVDVQAEDTKQSDQ